MSLWDTGQLSDIFYGNSSGERNASEDLELSEPL
jgi:hypothetical protein